MLKPGTGEALDGRIARASITVSVGVAASVPARAAPPSLLERADQCMYVAKRTGRNRTVTDTDHTDAERLSKVAA